MSIDDYLAELRRHLRVGPLAKRRILKEIEGHLADAVHREQTAGQSRHEAEAKAASALGPPDALAATFRPQPRGVRIALAGGGFIVLATATAAALILALRDGATLGGRPISAPATLVKQLALGREAPTVDLETLRVVAGTRTLGNGERLVLVAAESRTGKHVEIAPASARKPDGLSLRTGFQRLDQEAGTASFGWRSGSYGEGGWEATSWFGADGALVGYETSEGVLQDRPRSRAVVGVARPGVARIVGVTAEGGRLRVPLNRWRGFAFSASRPSAPFPSKLLAYDERGEVMAVVPLPSVTTLCGLGNCRTADDGDSATASATIWLNSGS